MKFVMICNLFIKVSFIACVTFAAIHFHKYGILWWYVLLPFIGYDFNETKGKESEGEP